MKILFTGASSFTGMWFARELANAGHTVTVCFKSDYESYQGTRKERTDLTKECCQPVFSCLFGSSKFFDIIEEGSWDLLCHHAANVTDYKNPDFNYAAALSENTLNIKQILMRLKEKGCNKILLTGSVFEQYEGAGSDNLRAVSPYGLSKGLTSEVFSFFAHVLCMKLGKFVIPNPFGPFEEVRYTTFLIQSWLSGKTPLITFPDYVRDNIPVSLLAKSYAFFATQLDAEPGFQKINPSGYVDSQGAFTERFAKEMRSRLNIPCEYQLGKQTDFSEPKVRINTDLLNFETLAWNETHAWDQLADYYIKHYGKQS